MKSVSCVSLYDMFYGRTFQERLRIAEEGPLKSYFLKEAGIGPAKSAHSRMNEKNSQTDSSSFTYP